MTNLPLLFTKVIYLADFPIYFCDHNKILNLSKYVNIINYLHKQYFLIKIYFK